MGVIERLHKNSESKTTWVAHHPKKVQDKGVALRLACHGPAYCAYCHVTGTIPASMKGP